MRSILDPPDGGRCCLPGGLLLEDGTVLTGVELRALSGREEEWIASNASASAAVSVTRLLAACVARIGEVSATPALMRKMLVGDRDYLMLQLRRLTLGERLQATLPCVACGEQMDLEFGASDVAIEGGRQSATYFTSDVAGSGRGLRFRLPTGGDQEAVAGLPLGDAVDVLIERCVEKPDDGPLSNELKAQVVQAMESVAPRLETELSLTCPACGHQFVSEFDTTRFFLSEMRMSGRYLLRETHALAFHYHWSEREILALRRDRRRAYLSLISEATRGN